MSIHLVPTHPSQNIFQLTFSILKTVCWFANRIFWYLTKYCVSTVAYMLPVVLHIQLYLRTLFFVHTSRVLWYISWHLVHSWAPWVSMNYFDWCSQSWIYCWSVLVQGHACCISSNICQCWCWRFAWLESLGSILIAWLTSWSGHWRVSSHCALVADVSRLENVLYNCTFGAPNQGQLLDV